ncbi:unannotated protein [freshwater metagenome]|uniref:Unannotated protein n=1 Tax=freshwater metagenome TaxID=449393 RepID=A0A6J6DMD6_9ZZZZ
MSAEIAMVQVVSVARHESEPKPPIGPSTGAGPTRSRMVAGKVFGWFTIRTVTTSFVPGTASSFATMVSDGPTSSTSNDVPVYSITYSRLVKSSLSIHVVIVVRSNTLVFVGGVPGEISNARSVSSGSGSSGIT